MGPLATFAIILAYGLSIYGWGLWLARTACRDARGFNGLILALGLTALSLIGGLLNLFHAAFAVSLDILTALGLMLFIAHLAASWRAAAVSSPTPDEAQDTFSEGALLVGILLAGVLFFHCLYLLPSRTINIFDDFFLYLVSPVRALQTGTLAGNPFESSGATTLGVPAFFQSFIAAHFALDYVPAFDNTLCLILTLLLIADLGRRMELNIVVRLLSMASAFSFNPQIVNTSSVYSTSAFALAFLMILQIGAGLETAKSRQAALFAAGAVGGVLVCLKSTLAVYAASATIGFLAAMLLCDRDWRGVARDTVTIALGALVLLLPWMLVYADDYKILGALHTLAGRIVEGGSGSGQINEPSIAALLTTDDVFLGSRFFAYAIILAIIGISGLIAVARIRRTEGNDKSLSAITVAQALGFWATLAILLQVTDLNSALRYVAPLAVAGFAICAVYFARLANAPTRRLALGALTPLIVLVLFAGNATERVGWAIQRKTQIAFESGRTPPVTPYLDAALSGTYQSWISGAQHRIPEGAGILTWCPYAFMMDFRRNHIYTLNDGSYHNPLFAFPGDDFARTTQVLRDIGVRYVLWEHTGLQHVTQTRQNYPGMTKSHYAMTRTQSQSLLKADEYMRYLAGRGTPLLSDGRIAIFDLEAGAAR